MINIYKQKVFDNHSQDWMFIWLGKHLSLYILSLLKYCNVKGIHSAGSSNLNFESRIESQMRKCIFVNEGSLSAYALCLFPRGHWFYAAITSTLKIVVRSWPVFCSDVDVMWLCTTIDFVY